MPAVTTATDAKPTAPPKVIEAARLRQLALDCGADDAGLVEITLRHAAGAWEVPA